MAEMIVPKIHVKETPVNIGGEITVMAGGIKVGTVTRHQVTVDTEANLEQTQVMINVVPTNLPEPMEQRINRMTRERQINPILYPMQIGYELNGDGLVETYVVQDWIRPIGFKT